MDFDENQDIPEQMKGWELLKYIIMAPNKAFQNIARHPNTLFPTIFIIIGMLVVGIVTLDKQSYIQDLARQYQQGGIDVGEGQLVASYYVTLLLMTMAPIVIWAVKSLVVSGVALFFREDVEFKYIFSAIGFSYFPVFLGQALLGVISRVIGKGPITIDFSILLPNSMQGSFIYSFLNQFDIFVIWYQVLAIIGLSHVFYVSKKKSSVFVLVSWLIWILIVSGVATAVGSVSQGLIQ